MNIASANEITFTESASGTITIFSSGFNVINVSSVVGELASFEGDELASTGFSHITDYVLYFVEAANPTTISDILTIHILDNSSRSHVFATFQSGVTGTVPIGANTIVENAVGAHLLNNLPDTGFEVTWWREDGYEVDFVVRAGDRLWAIEVKSGRTRDTQPGLTAFAEAFKPARKLLVGGDGIPVEQFLLAPVARLAAR